MRFDILILVFIASSTHGHGSGPKRAITSGSHYGGDPYGSIGAVLPPLPGAPLQGSLSENDGLSSVLGQSEFDLNSRYDIPNDDASYVRQTAKHSDHLALDSHSIHLSAHPIPYPGHGLGGYDTDLCHEGYDDFCYSPYGSNYVGHRNLHDTRYNNGHYSNMHYDIDSFPHFVGNVLSNADAMKLGFNQAYLKKLGFDGRVWHHRHHYGPHHVHTGGHVWLGGHGSLGGHVGNGACRQSVDLAFLVDGSADKANFGKFIDFVEAITKKLSVSEYGTRVALLTFADKGELKFGFDKYLSNFALSKALHDIKDNYKDKDGRKLGDALKIAKTDLFDVSGRDEKQKILVVVSDGTAGDSFNENAQALKDMAVSIYFVGPKANLKTDQVNALVSDRSDWFSFITDDYEKMIRDVAPTFPPIGCNVDMVFVVDCTKGSDTKLDVIKAFIRQSINGLSLGTRGDHVAIVTYGGRSEVKFNLNKKSHPSQVYAALQELECSRGGAADGAPALSLVKDVFAKSGHQGSINVTVYISGSKTASNLAEPARALRNMGVRLYGVGYGKEANEDDLKKIASLPSDYFVHVKDDEKKMAVMVGRLLPRHIAQLRGGQGFGSHYGGYGWLHSAPSIDGISSIGSIGGIGGYGSWGGTYLRSGVEPSYDGDSLDNLQDDTASVLKEVANNGADQDGFSTSLGPKVPELPAGTSDPKVSEYDKEDLEDSIREANGVDRATIESESLSVPSFDASHVDSVLAGNKRSKDYPSKKRTVNSKRAKKTSFRRRKLHKKAATSRNSIEANADSKNDTVKGNEATASKDNAEDSKGSKGANLAGSKDSEKVESKDTQVYSANNSTNATSSTRGKVDPYSSIGSDTSSVETASHTKVSGNKESGSEADKSQSGAAQQQKKASIDQSKSSDVHTDIISNGLEYKGGDKEAINIPSKMKEAAAVKKHMTNADIKEIEMPVHALVKSIFHKAAKNVMQDFTKSNGIQNIAKMLVKAAVHNAMLNRPSAAKVLKDVVKKQGGKKVTKEQKKKKKPKHTHRRSFKKRLDATKLVKDDLMAISKQKSAASKEEIGEVKDKIIVSEA